jgi:hypothetical protein
MTKAEILEELPRLTSEERAEVLEEIWRIEGTAGPTPEEIALLEREQAEFEADGDLGEPLEVVEARWRARK